MTETVPIFPPAFLFNASGILMDGDASFDSVIMVCAVS